MIEPTEELKAAVADVVNTAMRQASRPNAAYSPPHWHRVKQGSTEEILTAVLALVERDYHVQRRLPPLDLTPPDPCPYCTTGSAGHCPWHTDARDIP